MHGWLSGIKISARSFLSLKFCCDLFCLHPVVCVPSTSFNSVRGDSRSRCRSCARVDLFFGVWLREYSHMRSACVIVMCVLVCAAETVLSNLQSRSASYNVDFFSVLFFIKQQEVVSHLAKFAYHYSCKRWHWYCIMLQQPSHRANRVHDVFGREKLTYSLGKSSISTLN